MNKLEKTFIVSTVLSMFGIATFLVAGFKGNEPVLQGSFIFSGAAAWVAVVALILNGLRNRNIYGY